MSAWPVAAAVLPVLIAELGLLIRDHLSAKREIDKLAERLTALETRCACLR